jgi:hypothetical protein
MMFQVHLDQLNEGLEHLHTDYLYPLNSFNHFSTISISENPIFEPTSAEVSNTAESPMSADVG